MRFFVHCWTCSNLKVAVSSMLLGLYLSGQSVGFFLSSCLGAGGFKLVSAYNHANSADTKSRAAD